jgi:drug/metabolite transporter (DMT)-like permease
VRTWQIILAAFIVIISLSGQATIKAGLNHVSREATTGWSVARVLSIILNPFIISGFLLMAISAVCYLWLLRYTDFTRALPIMGAMVYLLIPVYGYVFLREVMSARQLVGLGLLLISIFLMRK